ncbi:class I SAM-dependent methyltransferase [Rhizobium oryziradicis]|uniref:Methyltransferase n=1 Tax=Rhizobium oryziradicis TaxID=1867956 RepID=A0A1Q8ZR55_9HYPH|nr:class I SAM-dependent methyltransferase [Rhizobium oryziradicis]OLP44412.1 methyltransferase [Rhizobium oryziradicis]
MSIAAHDNRKQYGNSDKLAARARLVTKYTISDVSWFPWIASQLPLKNGDHVLDIGCGPGWFWSSARDKLPKTLDLTLCDLSEGMVKEAQARCEPLNFGAFKCQQADASALPFEDQSFDAIIAMHMLYHVPDLEKAIADMHRLLKPGGFLAVTTNGIGDSAKIYQLATVFGSPPHNPVASVFGFDHANRMLSAQFGNVRMSQHPARLHITDPEDVFMMLTSFPPGDEADENQLANLRDAIAKEFVAGKGALETEKQFGLFLSVKNQ